MWISLKISSAFNISHQRTSDNNFCATLYNQWLLPNLKSRSPFAVPLLQTAVPYLYSNYEVWIMSYWSFRINCRSQFFSSVLFSVLKIFLKQKTWNQLVRIFYESCWMLKSNFKSSRVLKGLQAKKENNNPMSSFEAEMNGFLTTNSNGFIIIHFATFFQIFFRKKAKKLLLGYLFVVMGIVMPSAF